MVDGDLTKGNPYFYSTYEVKYGPGEMFAAKPTQFELRGCKMDDGELCRMLVQRRVDHHHMQKMCKSNKMNMNTILK
jgi:hypothetical protein